MTLDLKAIRAEAEAVTPLELLEIARTNVPALIDLAEAQAAAIESAGFRVSPSIDEAPTLWCLECGRDGGYHWEKCSNRARYAEAQAAEIAELRAELAKMRETHYGGPPDIELEAAKARLAMWSPVLPLHDAVGTIDVRDREDGHSHHYVPSSLAEAQAAEIAELKSDLTVALEVLERLEPGITTAAATPAGGDSDEPSFSSEALQEHAPVTCPICGADLTREPHRAPCQNVEEILRELVDTLPKCDTHPDRPATRSWGPGRSRYCDECGTRYGEKRDHVAELPSAAAVRKAVALREREGR
jgi:hypothetical protein